MRPTPNEKNVAVAQIETTNYQLLAAVWASGSCRASSSDSPCNMNILDKPKGLQSQRTKAPTTPGTNGPWAFFASKFIQTHHNLKVFGANGFWCVGWFHSLWLFRSVRLAFGLIFICIRCVYHSKLNIIIIFIEKFSLLDYNMWPNIYECFSFLFLGIFGSIVSWFHVICKILILVGLCWFLGGRRVDWVGTLFSWDILLNV